MHPSDRSSIISKSKDREASKVSINTRMDSEKLDVFTQTHRHNGILLSHKKNEILPFVKTSIDPENIILSEMSDTEG